MKERKDFFKDMDMSDIKSRGYIPTGNPALVDLGFPTFEARGNMDILYEAVKKVNGKDFVYHGIAGFSRTDSSRKEYKDSMGIVGREIKPDGLCSHLLILQPLERV